MKIGIVYLGRKGAGGYITFELARNLSQQNETQAFLSDDSEYLSHWHASSLQYREFHTYKNAFQAALSLIFSTERIQIAQTIREISPDVLLFPMFHPWNMSIQKQLKHIPAVVFVHDPRPHPDMAGLFYAMLENISIRLASRCVIMSKQLIPALVKRGSSTEKIDVIPLALFDYAKKTAQMKPAAVPVILFFGRIVPYKGVDILLKAFSQVSRTVPCELLIVGEGNIGQFQSILNSMENVKVINRWISEDEIDTVFTQADLLVLPYSSASQSGVIPIAASFALPVIATNAGGIPEQIEAGESGWLVSPGSVDALADAIRDALENPDLAKQRGLALRNRFQEHFGWQAVTRLVEESLEKAQQARGPV